MREKITETKENQVQFLEREILKHKKLYYAGNPIISDFEFDALEEKLRSLDIHNPVLFMVGSDNEIKGEKVFHRKKMLSLNKSYELEDLLAWKKDHDLVSTEKIDGSSCSLIYKKGELVLGKTRGNGQWGENITKKILLIPSIPRKLSLEIDIEIRGEVYCDELGFSHLVEQMEKRGLEKPNSMRNIVAGLLGRVENIELNKYLSFKAFDCLGHEETLFKIKKEDQKFQFLTKLGFVTPQINLHGDLDTIEKVLKETEIFMSEGDYLIDGIVFTYNDLSLQKILGETAHHPRYKMAFKFSGESKETKIKEITWQVSRNGILTPVAEVETVEISGANISRVTLHNWGVVKDFQLKPEDRIEIERSGEVIPKFIKVVKKSDLEFIKPDHCPSCQEKILEKDIRLVCVNDECFAMNLERTKYFIKSLGIDDLSTERIKEMFEKKLITKTEDIFTLTVDDLVSNLEGYKEKLAEKIIKNIKGAKEVDLLTFLVALGINGGGKTKCEEILKQGKITNLKAVQHLTINEIMKFNGFAEKSASEFVQSLEQKKKFINKLLELGLVVKNLTIEEKEFSGQLEGMSICITGTLSKKRSEIQTWIKDRSGKVVSSVTGKTTHLVCNDLESTSSKFKKAKELGILIISEEELFKL